MKEKIKLNITLIAVCVCVLSFSLLFASYGYFFQLDKDRHVNELLVEYLDKNSNTLSNHNVPIYYNVQNIVDL